VRRVATAVALVLALATTGAVPAPAPAPDFDVESLDGERITLAGRRARGPVLVDFWATWCRPCVGSLPELQALHERYGPRGLSVLGVSIDGPRNHARVRPFAARLGLRYPQVIDADGRMQERWRVRAVPTAFLVDTAGTVVLTLTGYRPGDARRIEAALDTLLPPVRTP
jgi:cytochrome c biogenesis protein CcmG/thiol:disulfide interchange protein DsbE